MPLLTRITRFGSECYDMLSRQGAITLSRASYECRMNVARRPPEPICSSGMPFRGADTLILDVLGARAGLDLPQIASAARLSIGEAQESLDGSDGLVERGLVIRSSEGRRSLYELNRSALQQRVSSTAA